MRVIDFSFGALAIGFRVLAMVGGFVFATFLFPRESLEIYGRFQALALSVALLAISMLLFHFSTGYPSQKEYWLTPLFLHDLSAFLFVGGMALFIRILVRK
jgi:hypothetical protein